NTLSWITDLSLGSLQKRKFSNYLLDTAPLAKRLKEIIDFKKLEENIEKGLVEAACITATNYRSSYCINFVHTKKEYEPWKRMKRESMSSKITLDHVMGSAAIPVFFPPVKIEDSYFGDGCLRNSAPIGPCIHLGGKKI